MRKLTTPLRALAALALATFTLTGCMKVDMNLTINADDTVSGNAIIAMDKRLLGLTGKTEDELVAEMTKDADIPKGAKQEKYTEGEFVGAKYVFQNVKLEEFKGDGGDDDLSLVHKDGKYTFDGSMDLSEIKLDDPATKAFADSFQVKISITFPGKVVEHNGVIAGNTVTWTPKAGQNVKMHAVSEEGSSFPWMLVIVLLVVVLLLVAAVVVVLVVMANKKKAAAAAVAADGDPAALATTEETVVTDGDDTQASIPAQAEGEAPAPAEGDSKS